MAICPALTSSARPYQPGAFGNSRPGFTRSRIRKMIAEMMISSVGVARAAVMVIFRRHCEKRSDEAIQRARSAPTKMRDSHYFGAPTGARLDCFASLAMTEKNGALRLAARRQDLGGLSFSFAAWFDDRGTFRVSRQFTSARRSIGLTMTLVPTVTRE